MLRNIRSMENLSGLLKYSRSILCSLYQVQSVMRRTSFRKLNKIQKMDFLLTDSQEHWLTSLFFSRISHLWTRQHLKNGFITGSPWLKFKNTLLRTCFGNYNLKWIWDVVLCVCREIFTKCLKRDKLLLLSALVYNCCVWILQNNWTHYRKKKSNWLLLWLPNHSGFHIANSTQQMILKLR